MNYLTRVDLVKNPVAKQFLQLMHEKKTNLSVAMDVTDKSQFLEITDQVGPEICLLKTHIDIVKDCDENFIQGVHQLSLKHNFLIFEDRKFADIGNTVSLQYGEGVYHIADWAPITNAHITPGPGVIEGLKQVGLAKGNALLLIAQLSSKGNLLDKHTQETALQWAEQHDDFVIGFIAQQALIDSPNWLTLTPGIHLSATQDNLSQQYRTPQQAIADGSDVVIVGRAIIQDVKPQQAAQQYRTAAWEAYEQRLK